jgi:basic membrane protein A and related proteins
MWRQARRATLFLAPVVLSAVLISATTGIVSGGSVDPWTWPGTASKGYLPPHEPAVHGGKVKIGLITAGTVHDHGYYQSEVTVIDEYAKKFNWTTIIQGSVPTANALTDAENMCSQGVDLLLIGESQLADAIPAARTSACKDTPVWISSTANTKLTASGLAYVHVAETTGPPSIFATGVAMGLWLKAHHETTAGFVSGPALSFTEGAAEGYLAGMQYVVKNAGLDAAYTGTFTTSGPAITAASAMIAKGIKLIFPYLGASLFPTAKYVESHGGASPSDGGQWCTHEGVNFAIEQVYDPGYMLAPDLTQFAHGKLRVGVTEHFTIGKTTVPSVSFCPSAGVPHSATATLKTVIALLEAGKITAKALIAKTPIPK